MTRPRVSIVLPTFNGERYIRRSIESCLAQTCTDLELIVVDDGSTDGTCAAAEGCTDARVRLIRHAENRRLPAALNTGFANANGMYLTWTSDDNYFAPDAIECMASYLDTHSAIDFVYTGYTIVDEHEAPVRIVNALPPRDLFFSNCIGACFLYRRGVYESTGDYDPALFLEEDYDYWFRVRRRFAMKNLPGAHCYVRQHPFSLTEKFPEERARRRRIVMAKYWSRWERYCFHALEALRVGRSGRALALSLASLAVHPFQRYGVTTALRALRSIVTDDRTES